MTVCVIHMSLYIHDIINLPQDSETLLHIAAYNGHVEAVKVLTSTKDKSFINARDEVSPMA